VLAAGDVLSLDESVLTGESAPVLRTPQAADATGEPEGSRISAGALLVRGHGVLRVTATGAATRLGQIGAALAQAQEPPTPLQRATRRLVGGFGAAAFGLAGLAFLAHGLLHGNWIGGVLAALTLGIALIPEEFPMVLAVFLALGGWRLAQGQVLVRRTAAIGALGAISILCVDKTGTLTRNRMRLAALWRPEVGAAGRDDPRAQALLQAAVRASAAQPLDPMDRALHAAARRWRPPGAPLRSYPLRPDRLAFIQAWPGPEAGVVFAAKGAPEAILELCRLSPSTRAEAESAVAAFARQGLRVLGVASAARAHDAGGDPGGEAFRFEGLTAFEDPVRDDVPPALAAAAAAGVKVVMITGDFPATALAIAGEAGIDVAAGVLTGAALAAMTDEALCAAVRETRVFARVAPDQKLRLVRALQANGERVGMFGDGVNDAPALEAADVGVAMGRRGVDVAREASDLILLDDRFASVVAGIAEGRRVFANLQAALAYLVAVHLPMAASPSCRRCWAGRRCSSRCRSCCWSWSSTRRAPWCSRAAGRAPGQCAVRPGPSPPRCWPPARSPSRSPRGWPCWPAPTAPTWRCSPRAWRRRRAAQGPSFSSWPGTSGWRPFWPPRDGRPTRASAGPLPPSPGSRPAAWWPR